MHPGASLPAGLEGTADFTARLCSEPSPFPSEAPGAGRRVPEEGGQGRVERVGGLEVADVAGVVEHGQAGAPDAGRESPGQLEVLGLRLALTPRE